MRKQITTGKQNYHQIMIELELRISFVQSMSDVKLNLAIFSSLHCLMCMHVVL